MDEKKAIAKLEAAGLKITVWEHGTFIERKSDEKLIWIDADTLESTLATKA